MNLFRKFEQKEKQDIWAFYRDKDKIITGAKFKIIDSKVSVDLEEISNELQRMKELIW